MSKRNRMRALVLVTFMVLAAIVYVALTNKGAKADGSPVDEPVATDPCFREDIECYEQTEVECDNNVFVPLNADGTWTCPGDQLPEEVIGSARGDCPDGQVSYVTDVEGHYICLPPADQVERGGSHPFISWNLLFEILARLLGMV